LLRPAPEYTAPAAGETGTAGPRGGAALFPRGYAGSPAQRGLCSLGRATLPHEYRDSVCRCSAGRHPYLPGQRVFPESAVHPLPAAECGQPRGYAAVEGGGPPRRAGQVSIGPPGRGTDRRTLGQTGHAGVIVAVAGCVATDVRHRAIALHEGGLLLTRCHRAARRTVRVVAKVGARALVNGGREIIAAPASAVAFHLGTGVPYHHPMTM